MANRRNYGREDWNGSPYPEDPYDYSNPGSAGQGYGGYDSGMDYDSGPDQSYGYGPDPEGDYDGWEDWDDPNEGYQGSVYQDPYLTPNRGQPSMAAKAAGKAGADPYGRSRTQSAQQAHRTAQARQQAIRQARASYDADYDYDAPAPRRRKRKKRHGVRNFILFLLLVAAIFAALYFLLFEAPAQAKSPWHTRNPKVYNILLCATDEEEMRTDTMMIATLDLQDKQISLTSIPRDTIVDNWEAVPKLNGVYGLAGGGETGAEAVMEQVTTLLGFRPDGYIFINYEAFRAAVDALGGVTFDVPMEMEVDNPPNYDEIIHLYPGEQLLNGDQALAVCRYRYGYLMADIQRQYVQQSFLKAMIQQAMSPAKWPRLPAVYRAVSDNTMTDLSPANLQWLAFQVLRIGTDDIRQYTLPGEGVDYNGASCYGLFGQSVVDMVNEVMKPYLEPVTLDDVYILTVSGGYLVESTWTGTAFDASTYQYD